MDPIGLSFVVGGAALIASGMIFLLPKGSNTSPEHATTTESLEAINHYLMEIRRQRDHRAARLFRNSMR
ncbi:hypothetical protein ES703_75068 [subsurface metagenome]|jgi:hypothetical protein